jgi:hypothetical protein
MANPFRTPARTQKPEEEPIPFMRSGNWSHEGVSMKWDYDSGFVELSIWNKGGGAPQSTVRISATDAQKISVAISNAACLAARPSSEEKP